ncbi:transporter substrate-binding domain-containing protein [Rhizobium rhizogenes]|jgi:octopine/nopaline transport system substrate-binding protein|uniref:transporter substrate-binding domain-containing protein n=1 Tax=Rhizobium rhizogenes TaxID=359 RepID=UPI001573DBD8|nr:transporter substrate-binding domain-containing protein [Rhizobium rhizogenes]NTG45414.1 transporter substrate-binding domain-containing protein [Rhizobium rhizogenes]
MNKITVATLLCGLFAPTLVQAAGATLAIGTEGDAPQFSMADANGNVTGYDADVGNALCTELKLTCKFVVQSFSTLIPSIDTKRFDVIISGLGITDERRKKIDYSIPYGSTPQYFAVAKDSPLAKMTSLADVTKALSGKAVGVVNGTTYAKYIAKHIPDADLKTYDSTTQLDADLSAGRLDAAYGDAPTWDDFLKTPDGAGFTRVGIKIRSIDDPDTLGHGMGVGLRKGDTELQTKLDKALCKLINDGTMTKISTKWFNDDYTLPCKL